MRTETKIGVVAGFAVVVAASVYFWKSKSRDRDLIVALTPSVVQPVEVGGAAGQETSTPARMAAAPSGTGLKPVPVAVKPEVTTPVVGPPVVGPAESGATPDKLAASPEFVVANPKPAAVVPTKMGLPQPARVGAGDSALTAMKPMASDEPLTAFGPNPAAEPARPESARIADSTSAGTVRLPPAIAEPPAPAVKPAAGDEWKSTRVAPGSGEWPKYHTVTKGETLAAIARTTYGDVRRVDLILAANPEIKSPRLIRVGTKLTLPSAPDAARSEIAAAPNESRPISLMARTSGSLVDSENVDKPAEPPATAGGTTYTVKPGDSLYSIAAETLGDGRRWPDLMKANKAVIGADGSKIRPGMVLTVPQSSSSDKPGAEQSAKR